MATTAAAEVTSISYDIPRILAFAFSHPFLIYYGCPSWSFFAYHTSRTITCPLLVHPPPHHVCYLACDFRPKRPSKLSHSPRSPSRNYLLSSFLTTGYKAPPLISSRVHLSLFLFRELLPLFSLSLSLLFSRLTLRAVI